MTAKPAVIGDLELVGRIYDAALQPDLWDAALAAFAVRIGASSGSLSLLNVEERVLGFCKTYRRSPEVIATYRDHYVRFDPYLEKLPEEPQTRYLSHLLLPEADLMETLFYRAWLQPQDVHYQIGSVALQGAGRVALVDWQRSRAAGPFGDAELTQLARFEEHFKRALVINQKFWDALSTPQAALDMLEHLEFGVIFIDERYEVSYTNPKAVELMRLEDGLLRRGGRLIAAESVQTERLNELLEGAVDTGAGRGLEAGGAMWVGTLFDRTYYVLVSPLRTHRADLSMTGRRVCAVVFLSSPYQPYAVSVQTFRSIHGLTPAESHLVGELANGLTLDQIARRFQVTKNTVRDQLKSVFAKTGIRRQAELIRLIRATPTTFVNETILFGTTKPNPMEQRQDVDRRLSGRVTVQADS